MRERYATDELKDDPEDALAYIRGVANILNRLACGDQGGGWVYDEQMLLLLGRDLLEAADALEAALMGDDGAGVWVSTS